MRWISIGSVVSVRINNKHVNLFHRVRSIGFTISPKELYVQVEAHVAATKITGWASLGPVISALKNTPELRWANPLEVKTTVDKVFLDKFGPKEATKPKAKVGQTCFVDMLLIIPPVGHEG